MLHKCQACNNAVWIHCPQWRATIDGDFDLPTLESLLRRAVYNTIYPLIDGDKFYVGALQNFKFLNNCTRMNPPDFWTPGDEPCCLY